MKISLHAEFDSAEEYSAFVDMLTARPVAMRPFEARPFNQEPLVAQEPEPQPDVPSPPPPPPAKPVEPEPPVKIPEQPEQSEPPVAAKPKRTRRTKAEMQAAQAAAPVSPTPATAPVVDSTPVAPKGNGKKAVHTREDLSAAFTSYVQKYGMAAAQSDINKLLVQTFGPNVRRVSDVSEDQIPAAIAMAQKALVDNPFQRGQ